MESQSADIASLKALHQAAVPNLFRVASPASTSLPSLPTETNPATETQTIAFQSEVVKTALPPAQISHNIQLLPSSQQQQADVAMTAPGSTHLPAQPSSSRLDDQHSSSLVAQLVNMGPTESSSSLSTPQEEGVTHVGAVSCISSDSTTALQAAAFVEPQAKLQVISITPDAEALDQDTQLPTTDIGPQPQTPQQKHEPLDAQSLVQPQLAGQLLHSTVTESTSESSSTSTTHPIQIMASSTCGSSSAIQLPSEMPTQCAVKEEKANDHEPSNSAQPDDYNMAREVDYSADDDNKGEDGCWECGGPHLQRDCPHLLEPKLLPPYVLHRQDDDKLVALPSSAQVEAINWLLEARQSAIMKHGLKDTSLLPKAAFHDAWSKLTHDVKKHMASGDKKGFAKLLESPAYTPPGGRLVNWPPDRGGSWIQTRWVNSALKSMCTKLYGDLSIAQAIVLGGKADVNQLAGAWKADANLRRLQWWDSQQHGGWQRNPDYNGHNFFSRSEEFVFGAGPRLALMLQKQQAFSASECYQCSFQGTISNFCILF